MARNTFRNWLRASRMHKSNARNNLRVNRLEDRTVPANISGTIYQDWTANGTRNLNDPGIAGQMAYIDVNNNGSPDATRLFTAVDTPIAIPDFDSGTPGVATSTVAVTGLVGNVTDVDVRTSISHTFAGDLIITLISPTGTRVVLSNRRGGENDNYINTVFSDQASAAIATGAPPFTDSYIPEEPLSAFNNLTGNDLNATWTLEVSDNAALDEGAIDSFTVIFTTDVSEPTATTDANGLYTFANLPAGTYTIGSILDGSTQNVTGPSSYTVTLGTSAVTGRDFGRTDKNAIYGVAFNDANSNGTLDGAEALTPGVTVYFDENGNSQFTFQELSTTATDTPIAIPDFANGVVGVATSSMNVTGFTQAIDKVTVTVNITHTYVGDLVLTLISPNGTRVVLCDQRGASGDNLTNTVFDDEATSVIGSPGTSAPYAGSYHPEEPLSVLNGLTGADVNGTWMLEVTDNFLNDEGTIEGFTLDLSGGEAHTTTDSLGNYKLSDLAPGNYSVRAVAPAGTTQTAPAGGAHAVTLAAGATAYSKDFGFGNGGGGTSVSSLDVGSFYNSGLPSAAAQRSRIDQLRVVFNSTVTFTGAPAAAFTLQRTTGASGPVGLNVVTSVVAGRTVATLTFTNNTEFGSLVDGRYTLSVLASGVQGLAQSFTQDFHRRYGDSNGDQRVDIADFGFFSTQYLLNSSSPNFLGYFMYNIDGGANQLIDITEFGQFSARYLQPFNP